MNIFDGTRRISLIITVLITIGFVISGFDISPDINVTYDIKEIGKNQKKKLY